MEQNLRTFRQHMPQKYQSNNLHNFCAIDEVHDAHNATMFRIRFDESVNFMQQMTSSLSEGDNNDAN